MIKRKQKKLYKCLGDKMNERKTLNYKNAKFHVSGYNYLTEKFQPYFIALNFISMNKGK